MSAQLAEDEFPARAVLKGAQEHLAAVVMAASSAAEALTRGRERQGELEQQLDAARAEVANEAITLAEAFEHGPCAVILGGEATQKRRDLEDQLSNFKLTVDILVAKNSDAQREIVAAEAAINAGIKLVIEEETRPILARALDCERAASLLRGELRALIFCGKWGVTPESLPRLLAQEPVNVHHADLPLSWQRQKIFDKCKAAWVDFADRLRSDPNATRDLGD